MLLEWEPIVLPMIRNVQLYCISGTGIFTDLGYFQIDFPAKLDFSC